MVNLPLLGQLDGLCMCLQWESCEMAVEKATQSSGSYDYISPCFESNRGKMLVPKTFWGVRLRAIDIDKDVTKDRNLYKFKTFCERRKSGAGILHRKTRNCLHACYCIAGKATYLDNTYLDNRDRAMSAWTPEYGTSLSCHVGWHW